MANEWVKVELYGANNDGNPRRYTIATGTSVSKGQPLQLTSARTVTAATGALHACAGIAMEEHIPDVGVLSISVWTDGIFRAVASGVISIGDSITFADLNKAHAAGAAASGSFTVGYALEAGTAGDTISVRLRL